MPTAGLVPTFFQAAAAIQQSAALGSVLQDNAVQILSTPSIRGLVQGVLNQDNQTLQQASQAVRANESAGQGPIPTMILNILGAHLNLAEYRDGLFAQVFGVSLAPTQGLGLTGGSPSQPSNPPPQIPALNQAILTFAQAHLGAVVGGGQCAPFVEEALRAEGGNFIFSQSSDTGDSVWGSLVTKVTAVNGHPVFSNPSAFIQPGDIIQFQNAVLSNGNGSSSSASLHTAIVARVDAFGRPTAVYEQNVNNDFHVRLDPIDLNTLVAGTLHVYQPIARQNTANGVQFSVFNDTAQSQTVKLFVNGSLVNTLTLDRSSSNDAPDSYYTFPSFPSNATISVGNSTPIAVRNAAGYEVYTLNGQTAIRQV